MIKGLSHVGISVADIKRSIEFYRTSLGMQVVDEGTFEPGKYAGAYEAVLGLEGATGRAVLLKRGRFQLELFEFHQPTPRRSEQDRPVCDHGITHFCLEVDDIEAEYARLRGLGVRFHCPPQRILENVAATYARDPDGNVFELVEMTQALSDE